MMSPRRRQSATAGPAPAGPRHQVGRTGWAAGHGCLRGSYEARSPPGPLCRAPGRFTRDWVFVYFYSQSIHTTLSSVARRRLSTRAGLQTVSRPDIAIDLHTHRPRLAWACLHCLSLISAWSDVAPPLATCCLLAALRPEPQISQPSADPCLSCRLALSCSPVLRIVRSCAWCDVCAPRPRATASQPPVPPAQHSSLPHRPAPAHSPPRQTTLSPNIFPHHLPPSPLTSHSPPHIPTSHTISA